MEQVSARNAGTSPTLILLVLVVAETTSSFEISMMYSALATMYRVFDDPVGVGWLITAYLLVSAASAAVCARLGDLFGRSRLVLAILMCSAAGSTISAFSSTLPWIIFGRALQGMSAAILPLCFGLAREHLPVSRVPVAIGWLAAMASVGAGVGILLGGYLVDHLSWQWIFYFSASHATIALVLVKLLLPASPRGKWAGDLDVVGGMLFVPAIAAILFAVTKGKAWGWGDARTLGMLGGGIAMVVVWVRYEWRHKNPLIDVRQLATRQVGLANVVMAMFGLGTSQLMMVLLLLLQQPVWTGVGMGVSATFAGAVKLPSNFAGLIGAPWSGRIASRRGARRAALVGVSIILAGWATMTAYHGSVWFVGVMTLIVSLGGAMVFAAVPNLIIEASPQERTSEATGLAQVVRSTFTAVGAQMAIFLLASSTVADPAQGPGVFPAPAAYVLTFAAITVTAVVALLAALALPRRKQTRVVADDMAVGRCHQAPLQHWEET